MDNFIESAVKPTVLVVDDTPDNLSLISELLEGDYRVRVANSAEKAFKITLSQNPPDLILLDIMMPVIDGYEVCQRLKENLATRDIPIIFLAAKAEIEDETKGFSLGAVDYITKPISPPILLARLKTHLQLKEMRDCLADMNAFLETEVRKRTQEVIAVQEATILALSSLAETRDLETGDHIRRTQLYIKILAETLRYHPRYSHFLNDDSTIDLLFKSAPLHDIGKVGIADNILLKPGRLTPEEFESMKNHTTLGRDAIMSAERRLGVEIPFLAFAKEIAYSHHEKWDGTGYPLGISGDDIPVSGRLMAIADVYDALISHRVYKDAIPHEKAVQIMVGEKGRHFDPLMIDAFLEIAEEFRAIMVRYADKDQEM